MGLFDKIKNKINITSKEKTPQQKMEEFVNIALSDGVLTEDERSDLYAQVGTLGINKDEFKFFLDKKIEEMKQNNMSKMEQLIFSYLENGDIDENERKLLFDKAKQFHIDELDFQLFLGNIEKNYKKTKEIKQTVSNAESSITKIESDRKRRQEKYKHEQQEYNQRFKALNVNNIEISTIKSWWKGLDKSEKKEIKKKTEVSSFLGLADDDYKTMYKTVVLVEKNNQLKEEFSLKIKEEFESESKYIDEENLILNNIKTELTQIPQELYSEYNVSKLLGKIEVQVKVDVKVQMKLNVNITGDLSQMISSTFNGIDKLFSNDNFANLFKKNK